MADISAQPTITERVRDYREGRATFDELRAFLLSYQYQATGERTGDILEREWNEDPGVLEDGTWEEVSKCWMRDLLTDDEYYQLVNDQWEEHAPERKAQLEREGKTWT